MTEAGPLTMQTLVPDDLKECLGRPSFVLGGPPPYAFIQGRTDGAWVAIIVAPTERTPAPSAEVITFNVLPNEEKAVVWAALHLSSIEVAWVERAKCH